MSRSLTDIFEIPDENYTSLCLLMGGLRKVAKFENITQQTAVALKNYLKRHGCVIKRFSASRSRLKEAYVRDADYQRREWDNYFAALTMADLNVMEQSSQAELSNGDGNTDGEHATRQIGELLGYPACCVESFIKHGKVYNQSFKTLRPCHTSSGRISHLLNNIPLTRLILHQPCTFTCERSIEIAQFVLDAIRRDFSDSMASSVVEQLKHPILYWDIFHWVSFHGAVSGNRIDYAQFNMPPRESDDQAATWMKRMKSLLQKSDSLQWNWRHIDFMRKRQRTGRLQNDAMRHAGMILDWTSGRSPIIRNPSTAFLFVRQHSGPEIGFFDDTDMRLLCRDLSATGILSNIFVQYVPLGESKQNVIHRFEKLRRRLEKEDYGIVVHGPFLDEEIGHAWKDSAMFRIVSWADALEPVARQDSSLLLPLISRKDFLSALQAWSRGFTAEQSVQQVFNNWRTPLLREDTTPVPGTQSSGDYLYQFFPEYRQTEIDRTPEMHHMNRYMIRTQTGCPYNRPLKNNSFFRDINWSASQANMYGCSFCNKTRLFKTLTNSQLIDVITGQLESLIRTHGQVLEILLPDRKIISFLDEAVERISLYAPQDLGLMLQARVDTLLTYRKRIERAALSADRHGIRLNFYLVGFENFSDAELQRFNKNIGSAQIFRCIRMIRELEIRFPRSITFTEYSAHGFILFNPWTELQDLQANVRGMVASSFFDFRHDAVLTKLRMSPGIPLYYRAIRDGLIIHRYHDEKHDTSRRTGYAQEVPWKFQHPATACVFQIVALMYEKIRSDQQLPLLHTAILHTAEHSPIEDIEIETVVRDFMQRHAPGIEAHGLPALSLVPMDEKPTMRIPMGGACNNNCSFCQYPGIAFHESIESALRQLEAGHGRGFRHVRIFGKEPAIRNDVPALLRRAAALGFERIIMETNGRIFTYADFMADVADAGCNCLSFLLCSDSSGQHDRMTGVPGSFQQTMAGILNARRIPGMRLEARVVLTPGDSMQRERMQKFARSLGFTETQFIEPID